MKATNLLRMRPPEVPKVALRLTPAPEVAKPPVKPKPSVKPKPPAKPRPAPTNARAIVKPTPGHMGVVWPAHPRRAAKEPAVSEEVSRNINALFDCWCVHLCISRDFALGLAETTFRVYRDEIRKTAHKYREGSGLQPTATFIVEQHSPI